MRTRTVLERVDIRRARVLRQAPPGTGPVVYWMSRDQRCRDNWALLHAQDLAMKQHAPLAVLFCLVPFFLGATSRPYGFMLRGLRTLEADLAKKNIPFFVVAGTPQKEVPRFLRNVRAGALVTDFDPLRIKQQWVSAVVRAAALPVQQVDSHNIVPCWTASSKQEFGAYTMRPKIKRLLAEYLTEFPPLHRHPFPWPGRRSPMDWEAAQRSLRINGSLPEVAGLSPGERAARTALRRFTRHKLLRYAQDRNDAALDSQSGLSPYLHFGQLSAQRVALETMRQPAGEGREAFLEELIIRRELSDNFCFYNPHYDSFRGLPVWARETLGKHRRDPRSYRYSLRTLEQGRTHDQLWNAAQQEMVRSGRMHGYMRMYWAKKILEWTATPEQALRIAIFLNDRYQLDGRDPNGYTGIAWSIGGVHDRPWPERRIFGKVRYMSAEGCARKFDVPAYIEKVSDLPEIPADGKKKTRKRR